MIHFCFWKYLLKCPCFFSIYDIRDYPVIRSDLSLTPTSYNYRTEKATKNCKSFQASAKLVTFVNMQFMSFRNGRFQNFWFRGRVVRVPCPGNQTKKMSETFENLPSCLLIVKWLSIQKRWVWLNINMTSLS